MAKAPKNLNWGAFNPGNLGGDYLGQLRDDVYGGYKQKSTTRRVRTGRSSYGNETTKSLNTDYYRQHGGWSRVADHIGIKSINSNNDIRAMYDYVSGYRPPAPAAPAPAPAPKAAAPTPVSNPYKDQADTLMKTIQAMTASNTAIAKAQERKVEVPKPTTIFAASQAVQPSDLTIASAGEASKQTGTSSFKRRKKTSAANNLRTIQSVNV